MRWGAVKSIELCCSKTVRTRLHSFYDDLFVYTCKI